MARSKFFNNSYTATAEIKALRASAVSDDLVITVPKSNYLGNITCTKPEYKEILNFIKTHFILPALTLSPGEMNPEWLSEFWFTCTHSVVDGTSQLQGFIDNGSTKIIITANIIRTILQLPVHEVYEPLPDGDTAKGGIVNLTKIECKSTIDANGHRKYSTVHKTKMDGVWNALFSNLIQCLGTKTGSYDQFSSLEAQISWSLVNSLRVDYASVIFNELVTKVAEPARAKYVPYSRFLSLIFKDQFTEYDRIPFQGFEPTLVGSQIFAKPATVSLPAFMKTKGILAPQPVTTVHPSVAAPPSATSLTTPPVTTVAKPPSKKSSAAPKRKSKLGSLTLKDQGHSKKKTSTDAKGEAETERSVPAGTLDQPLTTATSLVSRKTSDFKKGKLKTATMAQPIVSSDSGASHTHLLSQPISHLSSSQKDDISEKGLVASAGDNTLIADVTPLATDPGHLSSITAQAANVSSLSHDETQASISVSDDPSAKTQAGDDEEAQPMDTSDDETPPPPPPAPTAPTPPPVTTTPPAALPPSPIQELDAMSLSSDNISKVAGADPLAETALGAGDQGAQSQPQQSPPIQTASPSSPAATYKASSSHSSTDQLLLEYIASSQKHIKLLTDERDALKGSVTQLTQKVEALAGAYNSIPPWSSEISEKVKILTDAGLIHSSTLQTQSKAISELATASKVNLSAHDAAISSLTAQQTEMASSILEYIKSTDQLAAAIPKMASHQQATKAEVAALRIDNKKLYRWMKECVVAFYDDNKGEREVADNDVFLNQATDHREILLESFSLRPIAERPELEAEAVAEISMLSMDTDSDEEDCFDEIPFPEFHPDELRTYDKTIKEWAADESAKIEGESVSYELARWQWMNRENVDVVNNGDDGDNNDGDDDNGGDKKDGEDADDDENMEDQQHISSILTKRKRTSELSTSGSTSSKQRKKMITEEDISATMSHLQTILEKPDSSSSSHLNVIISEITPSALLSSDSTSGSLHPEETKEQRIARKIKARQEKEREMILKIQAEAELREEEERKRRLKEQSDSDRKYMLKLSGEEAEERERLLRIKKDQEESDAILAKLVEDDEMLELLREKEAKTASKASKKKGGEKASVDRLWNEIDRKKYAARMTGRSNPAPITKVNLKKPKNQSQAQLLIHRGTETQAITLDQICKMHREEWNEIRLAVSHSSSAAKREVLNEIDRLFQKMVALQLLRPEDTVIHGEEIVQPPSPRYRSGTSSIYRIPNTSRLNLSIPDGVPRIEGFEVSEGERGLVFRDLNGALRFQREAELEKIDHEQLVHLIQSASMLDKSSHIRKAILEEALARQFRYLPSTEKYELADELGVVKDEEFWRDL